MCVKLWHTRSLQCCRKWHQSETLWNWLGNVKTRGSGAFGLALKLKQPPFTHTHTNTHTQTHTERWTKFQKAHAFTKKGRFPSSGCQYIPAVGHRAGWCRSPHWPENQKVPASSSPVPFLFHPKEEKGQYVSYWVMESHTLYGIVMIFTQLFLYEILKVCYTNSGRWKPPCW